MLGAVPTPTIAISPSASAVTTCCSPVTGEPMDVDSAERHDGTVSEVLVWTAP